MKLSEEIALAIRPLLELLPLDKALDQLVVTTGPSAQARDCVESVLASPALAGDPSLAAGLWLYVDDLNASHTISQGIETATGSFWHGIMHRREGDFSNSHYWFHRVGAHPAIKTIADYEPHRFIDEVSAKHAKAPADLVARQRREWVALFEWCANQPESA